MSHDVVYYVFAHRKELDFESVLDGSGIIALSPEVLMKVLYAHTRSVSIMNFCLNPNFTMLEEFCRYFSLYWSYEVVDAEQFDDWHLEAVGHPSGHLERIRYLGRESGGSTHEQSVKLYSLWRWNQDWYVADLDGPISEHDDKTKSYLSRSEENWSTVDVDSPYTWCWECNGVCTCTMETDSTNSDINDIDK